MRCLLTALWHRMAPKYTYTWNCAKYVQDLHSWNSTCAKQQYTALWKGMTPKCTYVYLEVCQIFAHGVEQKIAFLKLCMCKILEYSFMTWNCTNIYIRPFHKNPFRNFPKPRADIYYILIDKLMLEKVFCSNIAPSLSSRNYLFYKAEYMGQGCPN